MATLTQRLGLKVPTNNIGLKPTHSYMSRENMDFIIRELCCGTCGAILAVDITEHPGDHDLVWPHKVVCLPEGHLLATRAKGEDGNIICKGRGVTKTEATEYLKRYE